MSLQMDGSLRIDWSTEEHSAIRVYAPRRGKDELIEFARRVADAALTNRTPDDLRVALRRELGATFDLEARHNRGGRTEPALVITLHPPPGEPNPDPPGMDEWS